MHFSFQQPKKKEDEYNGQFDHQNTKFQKEEEKRNWNILPLKKNVTLDIWFLLRLYEY